MRPNPSGVADRTEDGYEPQAAVHPRWPATLRWLHLADLHVSHRAVETLESLRRVIRVWVDRFGQTLPDAVFITGGLTQTGASVELEQATMVFAEFGIAALGGAQRPSIWVVPSAGDVEQLPVLLSLDLGDHLNRYTRDHEERARVFDDPEHPLRKLLRQQADPYARWWTRRVTAASDAQVRLGPLPGDFAATVIVRGLRVGILGLNLTMLDPVSPTDEGSHSVTPRRVAETCGGSLDAWAETHHVNLLMTDRSLASRAEYDVLTAGRFVAHLCGTASSKSPTVDGWTDPRGVRGSAFRAKRPKFIIESLTIGESSAALELHPLVMEGTLVLDDPVWNSPLSVDRPSMDVDAMVRREPREAPAQPWSASESPQLTPQSVRRFLDAVLARDRDFEDFCWSHFREIQSRFSPSWPRARKVEALLADAPLKLIVERIRTDHSVDSMRYEHLLNAST